jgi:hypothetical protein
MSDGVQDRVSAILAAHPKLIDPRATRSGADPFVIALAQENSCAVVCEERFISIVNPRIPDVCAALGVECINLLEMMRREGWIYTR